MECIIYIYIIIYIYKYIKIMDFCEDSYTTKCAFYWVFMYVYNVI
jgi:hypothetical protein